MHSDIRVYLSEDGADAERIDTLTGYLRQELLQLDVRDVSALRAGPPPKGSRGFDVAAVGALLVTLGDPMIAPEVDLGVLGCDQCGRDLRVHRWRTNASGFH